MNALSATPAHSSILHDESRPRRFGVTTITIGMLAFTLIVLLADQVRDHRELFTLHQQLGGRPRQSAQEPIVIRRANPTIAVANNSSLPAPLESQLQSMLANIDKRSRPIHSLMLSKEAFGHIQSELKHVAPASIVIETALSDAEGLELANQLKSLFAQSGFPIVAFREAAWRQDAPPPFIQLKRPPREPLAQALRDLEDELNLPSRVALNEAMAESEIVISVGAEAMAAARSGP